VRPGTLPTTSQNGASGNKGFWSRTLEAGSHILALALFGAVHFLLNIGVRYLVPSNMRGAAVWLEDMFFVAFSLVYLYVVIDMVLVFMPLLRAKPYPGVRQEKDVNEP
jgi:hypothetical protein